MIEKKDDNTVTITTTSTIKQQVSLDDLIAQRDGLYKSLDIFTKSTNTQIDALEAKITEALALGVKTLKEISNAQKLVDPII